ncbi:hypothetical protein [Alloalcanivorax gelatiniphagus]|uniref:HEAT repeat domain-containing protein n=1 Tax=Alloalcanivorax gelatiniphagus TaxID=1194167 RepID=A0ABY2XGW0_9GAMM|nr:hypothetical protein [Alloalcanivorax gelatiniphagus]TMW10914.1 hypothetical protein FGS76_16535 [Alloalcanivorax gelatiniphagus]
MSLYGIGCLRQKRGGGYDRVKFLSITGSEIEKKNAIHILNIACPSSLDVGGIADREKVLELWFSEKLGQQTFEEASSFIANNGTFKDVELLERVGSRLSIDRRSFIESAIVEIISRQSIDLALKRVVEKGVDTVTSDLVSRLFEKPESLTTETVNICLSAKPDKIRIGAAKILLERKELSQESAENLLSDSNHEIRLLAVEFLLKVGRDLDKSIVRKVLTIESPGPKYGLGTFSGKGPDSKFYERYEISRLSELNLLTLREKVMAAGVFCESELAAMFCGHRKQTKNEMRSYLKDGFKNFFYKALKRMKADGSVDDEGYGRIVTLEGFITNKFCTIALANLCLIGDKEDLCLIRKVLDEFRVDASESLLNYFSRFGEWEDVDRIKNMSYYVDGERFFSVKMNSASDEGKAFAIIEIGKKRIADIFRIDVGNSVMKFIIRQLPKSVISSLSDEVIIDELKRNDDEYRTIFALRCVISLPKRRLKDLLSLYVDHDGYRYYNSIHWLDLGCSLPSSVSKEIALRQLHRYNL